MEELEAVRKKEEWRKRRAEAEIERQKQAEIEAARAAQEVGHENRSLNTACHTWLTLPPLPQEALTSP